MDIDDDPEEGLAEEKEGSSGSVSLSGSFGSSLSSSNDFRRQMRPPNKKKHEEEMDELLKQIRTKETELRSLGATSQESTATELQSFRDQREVASGKRKKLENDLRSINQEITRKMGLLSRTESNLHYKNEARIDDAIRNMELQLKLQNFSLKEERKIVAEIDKLKRSKKTLQEYFTQKKDVDKLREGQRRIRSEKDNLYKIITKLKLSEEELKKSTTSKRAESEIIRKDLNELYERKRQMIADFKQHEADFHKMVKEKRNNHRKESFRKKEEDRKAKEQAWKKERMEYESQREPYEDEKNLCNTLISYLQRYMNTEQKDEVTALSSPRDEQPETQIGASLGPADSLDNGTLILLKKSENENLEYSVASKRTQRRSRKGRKLSVTKPLAHTPQIIAQFSSLTLNAPSNMSEVSASIEQLHARKRHYEEQIIRVPHPMLGNLNSSFSSSGSLSSLDSPLRERNASWSFVDVPPAIAENQTPSDAGVSAESGFHDMSRQVSKTESSESATDACIDPVLDELIRQSENECGDGENSRSSSDTITPEDHVAEDVDRDKLTSEGSREADQSVGEVAIMQGKNNSQTDFHAIQSVDSSESNYSLVFEEVGNMSISTKGAVSASSKKSRKLRGTNSGSRSIREPDVVDLISNYDDDFPPALGGPGQSSNAAHCDETKQSDSCNTKQTPYNVLVGDSNSEGVSREVSGEVVVSDNDSCRVPSTYISIVVESYEDTIGADSVSRENVPDDFTNSGEDNSDHAPISKVGDVSESSDAQASPEVASSSSSTELVSVEDNVTHF